MNDQRNTRGLLSREEAAAWLHVHPRTVDRERDRGRLRCVRIGRRCLYRRETLERFAASLERGGAA